MMHNRARTIWISLGVFTLGAVVFTGCKLTRWGYESANYQVTQKADAFEIREYPDLPLVSTSMPAAREGKDESFMRLFRYISGANASEQKIAMTTPVFMDLEGTNRAMSFVVPQKVAAIGAPEAQRDDVKVESRSAGRFAVYRFRGNWDKERAEVARRKLAEWLVAENLQPSGEPLLASYDPPFTPSFLKRNEIMVRIAPFVEASKNEGSPR